mmetsp:Transcript_2109/g.5588  ORF Transcript_2109/g.5588 Transcript_2109/m.5588 type:complete len:243 (-) Transcript_2109:281-1009(-)
MWIMLMQRITSNLNLNSSSSSSSSSSLLFVVPRNNRFRACSWQIPDAQRVTASGSSTTFPRLAEEIRDRIDPNASSVGSVGYHTKGGGTSDSDSDSNGLSSPLPLADVLVLSRRIREAMYSVCTPAPAAISKILHGCCCCCCCCCSPLGLVSRRERISDDKTSQIGSLLRSAEGDSNRPLANERAVGESWYLCCCCCCCWWWWLDGIGVLSCCLRLRFGKLVPVAKALTVVVVVVVALIVAA